MVFNPNEYIIRSLHEIFLLPVSDFEGYNKDKLSKIIKMLINNDYREKTEIFVTTV